MELNEINVQLTLVITLAAGRIQRNINSNNCYQQISGSYNNRFFTVNIVRPSKNRQY